LNLRDSAVSYSFELIHTKEAESAVRTAVDQVRNQQNLVLNAIEGT